MPLIICFLKILVEEMHLLRKNALQILIKTHLTILIDINYGQNLQKISYACKVNNLVNLAVALHYKQILSFRYV